MEIPNAVPIVAEEETSGTIQKITGRRIQILKEQGIC